jgi:hypothetical protein
VIDHRVVEATRLEQGFPPAVEDPATLATVAALLRGALTAEREEDLKAAS